MNLRRDVRAGGTVLAALVVLGAILGWLWAVLAPSTLALVLRDGSVAELPTESYHLFDDVALFALMGLGAGLVTGAAAWVWRTRRGTTVLLLVVLGSALSALVARSVGLLAVPEGPAAAAVGSILALPPTLGTWMVLVAQPLGAAFAYTTAVAFSGDDNLGAGPARQAEPQGHSTVGASGAGSLHEGPPGFSSGSAER
ncbi:DUF2567 domain-containing protein [Rhodococcus sp. X156]|uniref:DUF2567 domain-containing protein n=1 Tax=Rhodococcus sp. X156 TaxID=2499145 RepID=UPI0013E406EE|nr:DUF2567 domain-containing protein [Rhodococcus sp. X156]